MDSTTGFTSSTGGNIVSPPSFDVISFWQTILDGVVHYWPTVVSYIKITMGWLIGISFPLAIFFLIGIIYCVERLKVIRKKESEVFDAKVVPAYTAGAESGDVVLARRWESVTKHISSTNMNDWKQAILEADMILDEILSKMGYRGESVGEKLKRVATGDFKTLHEAWEAHKVRNDIAHTPGFTLTQLEAQQAIQNYKKVFDEFYYV